MYPSAIGTEPENPGYNSYPHWARVMIGHAAANMVGKNREGLHRRHHLELASLVRKSASLPSSADQDLHNGWPFSEQMAKP